MKKAMKTLAAWAAVAAAVWALMALAARALDGECDAHSHAAFGAEYDPAE